MIVEGGIVCGSDDHCCGKRLWCLGKGNEVVQILQHAFLWPLPQHFSGHQWAAVEIPWLVALSLLSAGHL